MNTDHIKSSSRDRVKKHREIRKMCKTDIAEVLHRVGVFSEDSKTKVAPKNEDAPEVSAIDKYHAPKNVMQGVSQGADVTDMDAEMDVELEINPQQRDNLDVSDISSANDIDEDMRMDIQQEDERVNLENVTDPAYDSHKSAVPEKNIVDELRHWAIESNIQQNHLDRLLQILRRELIPDLPKSSKTLLQTCSASFCIRQMEDDNIMSSPGEFAYLGIEEGLKRCVNPDIHDGTIELLFNVDGLPISKSPAKSFWPILCKVHHVPDIYSPYPVAIYLGTCKPKNLEDYFREFIEEINHLQEHGTVISGKSYEVILNGIVADTPARAFVKCCKCHGGYNACERCVVRGQSERVGKGSTIVYPGLDHRQRTDVSFRRQTDPEHHTGISPLI